MFKNKYRIVRDDRCYKAQVKLWWFPLRWLQIDGNGLGLGSNWSWSIDEAEALCKLHSAGGTVRKVEV